MASEEYIRDLQMQVKSVDKVLEDIKAEIKALRKRQWDAMEANVKNENYNPYLAEYLKGYMCALSTVEGIIAENETHDNDDCMFGDYMSPIV